MDGLDGRGEHVVVLAATNRPDAVDPALRRPGRFDKELRFSPPRGAAERRAVLEVHTRKWRSDQMPPGTAAWICDPSRTAGFTGADLKALTEEAVMMAVRRTYPQIYEEAIRQTSGDLNGAKRRSTLRQKFMVSASNVVVTPLDFTAALKKIVPSSRRRSQHATAAGNGNSLAVASPLTSKLFAPQITSLCSTILEALGQQEGKDDLNCGGVEGSTESPRKVVSRVISPATGLLLRTDDPTSILQYVLPGASLAIQERGVGVFVIDMCSVSTGQQAVLDTVEAALQNTPSLLLITDDVRCVEDRLRAGELEGATSAMIEACTCLSSLLMSRVTVHGSGILTLVLTHTVVASDADPAPWSADFDVLDMKMNMPVEFVSGWLVELLAEQVEENVRLVQREEHARQCAAVELPKTVYKFEQPSSESSSMKWESLSRKEMDTMRKEEDHWFRILRIQIREILKSLREFPAYRRWFYSPVDLEAYADYSSIISQPLCLEDMMRKNDSEEYTAVSEVVSDFEIIANNARTYNSAESQVYVLANEFIDRATLKCQCVDDNVVAMCKLMKERRESRETFLTQQSTGQYRSRRLHPDAGLDSPEPTDATHPMEVDEDAPPSFPEAPSPFTISEGLRMELKGVSGDLIEQLPKGDGPLWKRALPLAGRVIARLIAAELPTSSEEELVDYIRDALEGSWTRPSRMSCCSNDRLSGS
ncbi:hypothetical protein FOZ63_004683 [Perkinsus olseni]|uniref:Bromo domain-containing protein n=1 Tax=Perkinsus olseni TaxID=32597 RepID=A0A7J6R712_PEROL|nr:hypothetical protein FOZ63_004683 [Perkinsus olseni]